jgi:hypothetical protein
MTTPTPNEPEVIAEARRTGTLSVGAILAEYDRVCAERDAAVWERDALRHELKIAQTTVLVERDYIEQLRAERDDAVRDAQVVREIRARRNVVVEVSAELLKNGAFTDQPLHIMLTENGDGTHLLTFRVSDTIRELRQQLDASQRFSDEAVRAHTECERRLREATTRLAACEKIVAAAGKAREALLISADLLEIAVSSDDGLDASEAVVGINAARNAVLLLESQGIADPHAAVAAETHTDDEFGPNDGEARTVHRRAETQGEKDA